jgi:hypothetical protein
MIPEYTEKVAQKSVSLICAIFLRERGGFSRLDLQNKSRRSG